MTSESAQSTVRTPWTLLLGPGRSLGECLPLLEALAHQTESNALEGIGQLESWDALFCEFPDVGRILVDADNIALREVGLLAAFLSSHPGWELWLVGDQPANRAPRELLREDAALWVPAPLDVSSLREAVGAPLDALEEVPDFELSGPLDEAQAPTMDLHSVDLATGESVTDPFEEALADEEAHPLGTPPTDEEALLSEVERILRGESDGPPAAIAAPTEFAARPAPAEVPEAPEDTPAARDDFDEDEDLPATAIAAAWRPPAPYFKNQVADLADIVQSLDMTLDRAFEESASLNEANGAALALRMEELRGETLRLRQFTRTLAYIVSPPGRGNQRFELAPLLEEMLKTRRAEADAPRYLLRTSNALALRSDKPLIEQALDALLFFAHKAAGDSGTVRVDGRAGEDSADSGTIEVSIRFPAGRFADFTPEQLLSPYSLRSELPELGANSLAAANGILRGQGGRLSLVRESREGLEWLVQLPEE